MDTAKFSKDYQVRKLTKTNADEVLALCSQNKLYYEYCPPFITRQGVLDDMKALPAGKKLEDKYYVGFYQNEKLMAVMDLIDGYPEKGIAFIGFFMMDVSAQGQGTGTGIIEELCTHFKKEGYQAVRLCWVKGNPQAEHFWLKNKFVPIKETKSNVSDCVILAERILNRRTQ